MGVHAFSPSTQEAVRGQLVYKESSRTAKAVTQRNPVSKQTNKQHPTITTGVGVGPTGDTCV
ncbi:hypothetical protein I79_017837 [Cricetulus griseus]|uniref:Uncharacterized protein n=1 Tax=Cricetulus griseus TaxID=10029 RepID=G3I337_CRIGR|nr:hypothetical protein I79_017837 [Cricetulus griseus]